jgi:hypothetical protein
MQLYGNLGGNSNVVSYEIGPNYIKIAFSGSMKIYTYSFKKAGIAHVEQMTRLAKAGSGLNSYINRYVKNLFD